MSLLPDAHRILEAAQAEEWLTVKEVADLKRVSEETVRRWLRTGRLEAERTIQPHGHWRIKRSQLAA